MSLPDPPLPSLASATLAALAHLVPAELDREELHLLRALARPASVTDVLARATEHPFDQRLLDLGAALGLMEAELFAVALAAAVEAEPLVGRVLAWLQAPLGARPTLGLVVKALRAWDPLRFSRLGVEGLATGQALNTGLLALQGEGPLPDRAVLIPLHLLQALLGTLTAVPGTVIGLLEEVALPASTEGEARSHADGLVAGSSALVIRSHHRAEGPAAAAAVASALGATPLFIEIPRIEGLGPWLLAGNLVPVFLARLAPGEELPLPAIPGYRGPVLASVGPDGAVRPRSGTTVTWTLHVPDRAEREALWEKVLGERALAAQLAAAYRHGPGRIADLARIAAHHASVGGREQISLEDVQRAASAGDSGLSSLAQLVPDRIGDDVLVLTTGVRDELEMLVARCRAREGLVDGLGAASRVRYRPGVRALFVGPSGGGKTLAATWIATTLGLPLYRVDLASVVSKYIGETEKNLAELLARAEADEVVLFFDEADSLFGKRTEVNQATDRYANAQTNYLLQRIETYDGIVVLASNSRGRFDPAFTRRLDHIVEFGPPGPEERRALWYAHLGQAGHVLTPREVNKLSASCDLAGGHVRNAVLAAAVLARSRGEPLGWEATIRGLKLEYRKLGRPLPTGLL